MQHILIPNTVLSCARFDVHDAIVSISSPTVNTCWRFCSGGATDRPLSSDGRTNAKPVWHGPARRRLMEPRRGTALGRS